MAVSFVRSAVRPVDREQQAAVLAQLEGQRAVRLVQQVVRAAVMVPEWRAAAGLDGLLPVVQRAPVALQQRAASLASGKVLPERRAEFLQEQQAASAAQLPASSSPPSSRALPLGRVWSAMRTQPCRLPVRPSQFRPRPSGPTRHWKEPCQP
jgi:hypothetical protein